MPVPPRPLLRPGVPVLPRRDGWVQLGLDPEQAVLLPDSAEVRGLAGLDGSAQAAGPALRQLDSAGLLVGEQAVLPLLADPLPGGPAAVAALVRHRGDAAPEAVRRRRATRLEARAFGPVAGDAAADPLARLLDLARLAGLAGPPEPAPVSGTTGAVGVLAGTGEPDRELADPWTQAGTPYLVLRMTEGRAVVGPFVSPGETACLRCIDAHHTDADPCWPLLVHQRAHPGSARTDGLPEPVDPLLLALAAAWAARDLTTWAEGAPPAPSTWSATVTVDPALASVEIRVWRPHPECGCAWQ